MNDFRRKSSFAYSQRLFSEALGYEKRAIDVVQHPPVTLTKPC